MSFVLDALNKADRVREESQDHKDAVETNDYFNSQLKLGNDNVNKTKYFLLFVFVVMSLSVLVFLESMFGKPISEELPRLHDVEQFVDDSPAIINSPVETEIEKQPLEQAPKKPNYNITGHIFLNDRHSANKVFIDEISYRIGSQLPDGYKIINITANKLVVEKHGTYFGIVY